jgi:uncharacterized protein (UPF0333 family)
MAGLIFVVVIVVILLAVIFGSYFSRQSHSSDENTFSQAGVTVNYLEKTITIKKHTYAVSSVKGLRWKTGPDFNNAANVSIPYITVDDMAKPVHKISFITPGAAEVFIERVSLAIEKAGGPTFS